MKEDVLPFCVMNEVAGCFTLPPIERIKASRVVVATCGAAGVLPEYFKTFGGYETRELGFTHVMIDEAGQVRGRS